MTGFRRLVAMLVTLLALTAGATACASRPQPTEPPKPAPDPASSFPVKVTMAGQEPVAIPQRPKHIVSLSPTATETLYAIGAGREVVAADAYSTFPENAPRTELSGLSRDAAAVAAHQPDLVVVEESATELAEGLRAIDVPVLLTPAPANLEGAYQQIETLGQATGHSRQAGDLTRRMRQDIAEIVARTPKPPRPLTYFHEISPDYYTTTSRSFVGSVYAKFGLVNIADQAPGDFPQLAEEQIVRANPDLIFLADTRCCQVTPQSAAARPGWNTLTAVRDGRVIPLDDDIAGRWGPRIVDMVRAIGKAAATPPKP